MGDNSDILQSEIDRLSAELRVLPMRVGLRTNDGLNIFAADDGSYHFTFYERGRLGFDRVGSLDDLLYWYCEDIVSSQAAKQVGDRAERFRYEYEVLSQFDPAWAKRRVRELAALFYNGQPEDISLLPDIGEPLYRSIDLAQLYGGCGGNSLRLDDSVQATARNGNPQPTHQQRRKSPRGNKLWW